MLVVVAGALDAWRRCWRWWVRWMRWWWWRSRRYLDIYEAVYSQWSEVSEYQLRVIKCKLIKKVQDEFGVKKIPIDWITATYGQGFRLNMRRCEVEVI